MCNRIHKEGNVEKIPKSGSGWKLFVEKKGKLYPLMTHFEFKRNKKILWDSSLDSFNSGDGFCFFLSKKEALRAMKHWEKETKDKLKCLDIYYEEGLVKQDERFFIAFDSYEIALAKSFTIFNSEVKNEEVEYTKSIQV